MKMEETLVVTISLMGMAERGEGTATFVLNSDNPDLDEQTDDFMVALGDAVGQAMTDISPHLARYTYEKYVLNLDSRADS